MTARPTTSSRGRVEAAGGAHAVVRVPGDDLPARETEAPAARFVDAGADRPTDDRPQRMTTSPTREDGS